MVDNKPFRKRLLGVSLTPKLSDLLKDEKAAVIDLQTLRKLENSVGSDVLDDALQGAQLCYSEAPSLQRSPQFEERLKRLKLQEQQRRYSRLTANVAPPAVADDVNTKTMLYAASIGLNMIVAPLSFGCLLYYFGGGLLDWWWPIQKSSNVHIRKILLSVIGGVIMMIIEMVLFVIRTHAMDQASHRKGGRKQQQQPFGFYTSKTSKTYYDQEPPPLKEEQVQTKKNQ